MNKKLTIFTVLVVLIILLSFPLVSLATSDTESDTKEEVKKSDDSSGKYNYFIIVAVSVSFAMAFAAVGAAFSQAKTAIAAFEGIARQPEAAGHIRMLVILALVFIETLAIYTLVIALLLIFVNPFTKYIV